MSLQEIQTKLLELNVNEYADKKNGLTYLSWANAYREAIKLYPTLKYTITKDEQGKAYFGDKEVGYMVYTTVTIEDETREMWLPVMDFRNKAILTPTTMDINKAVMRCLVKNLAMFGLGTYIYAGEDINQEQPDNSEEIRAELSKITNKDDLKVYYASNKGKYPTKVFNELVTAKSKELS